MAQANWVERSIWPYLIAAQAIPILAIVPLIGIIFGFGFGSPRPRLRDHLDLPDRVEHAVRPAVGRPEPARPVHAASVRHVGPACPSCSSPSALPAIFTGFRIAAGLVGDRRRRRRAVLPPGRQGHRHPDGPVPLADAVPADVRRADPRRRCSASPCSCSSAGSAGSSSGGGTRRPARAAADRRHAIRSRSSVNHRTRRHRCTHRRTQPLARRPARRRPRPRRVRRRRRRIDATDRRRPRRRPTTTGDAASTTGAGDRRGARSRASARRPSSSRPTGTRRPSTAGSTSMIGDDYDDRQGRRLGDRAARRVGRRRHRRRHRDPLRRPGDRLPDGDVAAVHRRRASCSATSTPTRRSRTRPSSRPWRSCPASRRTRR